MSLGPGDAHMDEDEAPEFDPNSAFEAPVLADNASSNKGPVNTAGNNAPQRLRPTASPTPISSAAITQHGLALSALPVDKAKDTVPAGVEVIDLDAEYPDTRVLSLLSPESNTTPRVKSEPADANGDVVFMGSGASMSAYLRNQKEKAIDLDLNPEIPAKTEPETAAQPALGRLSGANRPQPSPTQLAELQKRLTSRLNAASPSGQTFGQKAAEGNAGKVPRATVSHSGNSLNADDEENANWQDHASGDDEDETRAFEKLKATFKRKEKKGTLTLEDQIEMGKAESLRTMRLRRQDNLTTPAQANEDDSIFVPEDENVHSQRKRAREATRQPYVLDEDEEEANMAPPSKKRKPTRAQEPQDGVDEALRQMAKKKPKKKRVPRAKGPVEVRAQKKEKEKARKEAKMKKQSAKGKKPKKRAAPKPGKPRRVGRKKKVPKPLTQDQREEASAKFMNLVYANAIEDRAAFGDIGEAPKIREHKNKARMLTELLESIPSDINKRQVTSDKKDLLQASKNFGHGMVKGVNGMWLLKGMKSTLYHHQLLGADWMVSRECDDKAPFGGLCADSMGVGKTVELLATVIGNPPRQRDPRTTLLVVPASLIDQWANEIDLHVKPDRFNSILRYKRSHELSQKTLLMHDIVITSYGEIVRSFPFPPEDGEFELLDDQAVRATVPITKAKLTLHVKRADWRKEHQGLLHSMKFYRVVLDEAHSIKNHLSRTSIACCALNAKFRWALSATPVQNRLEELYPYMKFLKLPYTSEGLRSFKLYYCNRGSRDSNLRLLHLLSVFTMRRTNKDKILGRPILELPKSDSEVKPVEFSAEERVLYEALEDFFRREINKYYMDNTIKKNYCNILVKLLRLRQCTCHPFLLEHTIREVFMLDDLKDLQTKLAEVSGEINIADRVELWVHEREQGSTDPNNGLARYLHTLDEEVDDHHICPICSDVCVTPWITQCKHIFCKECITAVCQAFSAVGSDYTECPTCQHTFTMSRPLESGEQKRRGSQGGGGSSIGDEASDTRRNKKKKQQNTWLNLPGDIPLSAKTKAVKEQIVQWLRVFPTDKIVVFTQFHLMAHILGRICTDEGWRFVYLLGDMKPRERTDASMTFEANPEIRIMIAGLKCGGIGLNLTMANRVISTDLWWNHSVELQAFGRVYRIGQKKECAFIRTVVKNSVDDRLLGMQAHKIKIVDHAMMDDGTQVPKLDLNELVRLFGYLTQDENGVPQVVADYGNVASNGGDDENDESEGDEGDEGDENDEAHESDE
ncbi:MAG: hypothetical protein M1833_001967 [Piccolia ochrophora]|nr:MAG: hypothetical protein M1833_001967 [Piccolia ochrophora]